MDPLHLLQLLGCALLPSRSPFLDFRMKKLGKPDLDFPPRSSQPAVFAALAPS
jgi:hypothetical protein